MSKIIDENIAKLIFKNCVNNAENSSSEGKTITINNVAIILSNIFDVEIWHLFDAVNESEKVSDPYEEGGL